MAGHDREPSLAEEIPANFGQLPIPISHRLPELLGYPGHARFVAFYWEQMGDEVVFDDGQSAGTGEWYPFKRLIEHPRVAPFLERYDFGSSDSQPIHWLVIDRHAKRVYAATVSNALAFLSRQHPARPSLTEAQIRSLGEEIHRLAKQLPTEAQLRVIAAYSDKQRRQVERLVQFLDRLPVPRR